MLHSTQLLFCAVLTPGREPEADLATESEVSARFAAMPVSLKDALMPFQREVRDKPACTECCLVYRPLARLQGLHAATCPLCVFTTLRSFVSVMLCPALFAVKQAVKHCLFNILCTTSC